METQLTASFIAGCIALLVLTTGFFIKAWFSGLNKTLHELSTNIHEMTQVINALREQQIKDKMRLQQLTLEVRSLQATSCSRTDCPNKPTNAGLHTRVDDMHGDFDV